MTKPLSKEILLQRGSCCGHNCVNCPYIPKGQKDTTQTKR